MKIRLGISVACFLLGVNSSFCGTPVLDEASSQILDSWLKFHETEQTFQFSIESPANGEEQQPVTQVQFQKPDKLRAEWEQNGTKIVAIQNAAESLIHFPGLNQFSKPSTGDNMEALSSVAPLFSVFVLPDARNQFLKGVISAKMLPDAKVDESICNVMELVQKEGTYTVSMEAGKQPFLRKFAMKSADTSYELVFRDWKVGAPFDASNFSVVPPEGATAYKSEEVGQGADGVQPIRIDPKAKLQSDFDRQKKAWAERVYVEPFKSRITKETWADAALTFVDHALGHWSTTELHHAEIAACKIEGQKLIESGCQDSLVLLLQGALIQSGSWKDRRAAVLYEEALKKAKTDKQNPALIRELSLRLRDFRSTEERKPIDAELIELTRLTLSDGTFTKDEGDILVRMQTQGIAGKFFTDQVRPLLRIYGDAPLEEWVKLCLEGFCEVDLAWASRGGGWASEVTDEGWKGFSEQLNMAREDLTKSWELHPESPLAAMKMISVSMAGSDGSDVDVRVWFDRSTAAQFDFSPAYSAILWAYRPRWGGSHEQMFAFGMACLDTKRFDTNVPQIFAEACGDIAGEFDDWHKFYEKKEVAEAMLTYSRAMVEEPTRAYQKPIRISFLAVNAYIVGNKEASAAALNQLAGPLDPGAVTKLKKLGLTEAGMRTDVGVK